MVSSFHLNSAHLSLGGRGQGAMFDGAVEPWLGSSMRISPCVQPHAAYDAQASTCRHTALPVGCRGSRM